jgi:hypothetical protein
LVRDALKRGVLPKPPDVFHLTAHFTRADLSTLRDYPLLKRKFSAIRKTYATVLKPYTCDILVSGGLHRISIRLVDTMLIGPAGSSLASLGDALKLQKVELPAGYSKARMDLFLRDHPAKFEKYAIVDAEIAARWAVRVFQLVRNEMGVNRQVATLGGVGVAMIEAEIAKLGLDVVYFFGRQKRRRGTPAPLTALVGTLEFAAQCYHGGRNEALSVGFSPASRTVYDLDLVAAYTSAMAMIRVPDWKTARFVNSLDELATIDDAMTFAHVRFAFPTGTRFPSLPVRASQGRGLVYPLQGEAWCTGPELVVALGQGADIQVLTGLRVDFVAGSPRPWEQFVRKIGQIRKQASERGDVVLDRLAKEVGNSAYGKIAQGVAGRRAIPDDDDHRRVFDTENDAMRDLGPSRISQPMLAAYITGVVRAAVSEAIGRIESDHWVGSVTTDGFLSTIPPDAIDQTGPVANVLEAVRRSITPEKPVIWEVKHTDERGVLVLKTRGCVSCSPGSPNPIVAKAGHRLDRAFANSSEQAQAFLELALNRDYDTRLLRKSLIGLRAQHLADADLVSVERKVRVNLDYDMKREPIDPRDVDGLLTTETRPWNTLDEFEKARDGLEAWKRSQRRVVKTAVDYSDMIDWESNAVARRAVGVKADNALNPLAAAFLRIASLGEFGLARGREASLAQLMTYLCGVEVSRDRISNARRRGRDPQAMRGSFAAIPLAAEGFVRRLYRTRPAALSALLQLLQPASAGWRRVQQIIVEEDELEIERSEIEWLERTHHAMEDDAV